MVDSGISSSNFGQAGVGAEVAGRRLGVNQALEFEVVEAHLGTLAGREGLTYRGLCKRVEFRCFMFLSSGLNFAIRCFFYF